MKRINNFKNVDKLLEEQSKEIVSFMREKKFAEALKYVTSKERLINQFSDDEEKKFYKEQLLSWKGFLNCELGKFEKAVKYYQEGISVLKK